MKRSVEWLENNDIRPYIYMRHDNLLTQPGERHRCDWFKKEPIVKNPLLMNEADFGNAILNLEDKAFKQASLEMPRWVFYDCAIIPGFVCGFARRTKTLPEGLRRVLSPDPNLEWTPISLFIIIPTVRSGEWVAHNLSSANALVEKPDRLYGLGFLTKAFGLWYANVEILCGFLQWGSPSIRLHSHYGLFQVLTAYTPIHTYARTMTYRSRVDTAEWPTFFKTGNPSSYPFKPASFEVDPTLDASLKNLQLKIESGEGPYYLDSRQIRERPLDKPYTVYTLAT